MTEHRFSQPLTIQQIDQTNSVIHGVGMISVGPVLGHSDPILGQPLCVDPTTLEQVMVSAQKYKTGLKVQADHGSGILDVIGFLNNFAIDGDTLRGDFHILDSEPSKDKIFEMASIMPDCFGFSVNFTGEDEIVGQCISVRCEEIFSCDLVTEPAACPTGLFSRPKVDGVRRVNMAIQTSPSSPSPKQGAASAKGKDDATLPSLADLAASHNELMTAMKGHMARFAKMEAAVAALAPSMPQGDPDANSNSAPGASGAAEGDEDLPFEASVGTDAAAAQAAGGNAGGKPQIPTAGIPTHKTHSISEATRAFIRQTAKDVAHEFAAKLGQSAVAAAAPGASTDKPADSGEKPEVKFEASVLKHFEKCNSKGKAFSMAIAECGDAAHRAFITSQKRIEFKRA